MIEVTADNVHEVLSALKQAVENALEDIGGTAETYAKMKCPVGTPESTGIKGYIGGTLRNSIDHEVEDNTVYIGTNVEYAAYVEMGTSKMAARPYLQPAVEDHTAQYMRMVEMELQRG